MNEKIEEIKELKGFISCDDKELDGEELATKRWAEKKIVEIFPNVIAEIERLEKENEELRRALKNVPENCPNCPNQGWYSEADRYTGEEVQIQCEFCYTNPNSVFNRSRKITKLQRVCDCAKDYYIAKEKSIQHRTEESQMEASKKWFLLVGALAEIFELQQALKET